MVEPVNYLSLTSKQVNYNMYLIFMHQTTLLASAATPVFLFQILVLQSFLVR